MIDRRLVEYFDWWMLTLTVIIGVAGLVAVYSAVNAGTDTHPGIFKKQLVWYAAGVLMMVIAFLIDFKVFERWGHLYYTFCIGLLLAVHGFGRYIGGSKRWLVLGPVSIQPSEMVKLAVIIMLAKYFARVVRPDGIRFRELVAPFFITALPFLLIVRQPDLGTAMMVLLIAASMTMYIKIERRTLFALMAGAIATVPVVWFFLKGYQKQRIMTFLNPERDPLGAGYHIIQSKIAIGSGQLTGKGFLQGTQNALDFLPEQHTDFIFSVLAEEWGLAGSLLVLCLFFLLIIWGLKIAQYSRDPFGTILAVGVTAMVAWHVFINIGMVMGLMPVVGVTLPFISYGGSSVITMMIGAGLLINVSMRRFMFEK